MPKNEQEPLQGLVVSRTTKPDTIQFELKIKQGLTVLADVKGREMERKHVTLGQMDRIVSIEQELEQLFGLRFHINQVIPK